MRSQLDIIGVALGHLPARLPFARVTATSTAAQAPSAKGEASDPKFIASLRDSGAFYELYVAITNRAIDLYVRAGRKKFALKLHGDLAALDLCAFYSNFRS
jgi:hypothetical protein